MRYFGVILKGCSCGVRSDSNRGHSTGSVRLAAYPVRRNEHIATEVLTENGNDVCCLVKYSVNWEILEINEGKAKPQHCIFRALSPQA
jgi:hypothetical protein